MLETGDHGYVLPFEVVTILLLAAMVGCIVIAIKTPAIENKTEQQNINETENSKEPGLIE
jgi:NADH-quinone oxidoreductase subunit J